MIRALVQFSLRFRAVVLVLAGLLLVYGIQVALRSKMDVFPDFVPPQVTVQTEAPALPAEDVEQLVTRPIEIGLSAVGGQSSIRSESIQGLSVITIVFEEGSDVRMARQRVAEKLGELVAHLPTGVQSPQMSPLVSSTMDLLKIGLLSTNLSPMELRTFADWTLKPRLLSIPGVAKCSSYGGEVRQIQIQVNPEKLIARNMALSDVLSAARLSTGVRGAGFIDTPNQRLTLQADGQVVTAEGLGALIILPGTNNVPLRLRDVARVTDAAAPKIGDSLINGQPGVLLTMASQPGANTLEVTYALETALEEFKPVFDRQGIRVIGGLHRPATFIERSLRNITHSLYWGALFVAVVLLLFLGRLRVTLISLTAIPLSLLTAIILMHRFGISLNTMTLGGLAVAIGEVVDDAIIDVENILRRLRQNSALAAPRPAFAVVLDASLEVRSAVVYATFIVILVFLPILGLTSLQGSFFSPLAMSYIFAILASLGVALTVTPALCLWLLARAANTREETWLQRKLRTAYSLILMRFCRWPDLLLGVVVVACILIFASASSLNSEFLPEFREGHFVLQVTMAPGASIGESLRIGKLLSERFLKIPSIASVEQQVGRAELGEDTWPPDRTEFHIELKLASGHEPAEVEDELRDILAGTPGIQYEITTFLGDRISESISGETASVVASVYGDDLDSLDAAAEAIAATLKTVPGAADVQLKSAARAPGIKIRLRQDRLAELGFRPLEVLDAIQTAYAGTVVAQTFRANEITDVVVILRAEDRNEPAAVGSQLVRNSFGTLRPLRDLADIQRAQIRAAILHDEGRRRQTVTCNPSTDSARFIAQARQLVAERVHLPVGFYLEFSGEARQREIARHEIIVNSMIAGVGILLLLAIILRNARNLMLVLLNLPFALVGGVLALHVGRRVVGDSVGLSMGALVGFVTLFGITTRNSIMLMSHYNHLVNVEDHPWNVQTAVRGANERLIPILMTALVTALGLLPLAIGSGEAGKEIEGPMAVVILGGLVTSTILNLLIVPPLALKYAVFQRSV